MLCLAYASRLKNWAFGGGVCIYTSPDGTPSISKFGSPSLLAGGADGVPGGGGAGSSGGALGPLRCQHLCGFLDIPFWKGRQPSIWFSLTIASCLSLAAFNLLSPGNWTRRCISSQTSAQGCLIRYWASSIAGCQNPPLAFLALFKARHMSDCSSCTQPPCLATVADMLKTYKKLVTASKGEIQLLRQPYMTR